MASTIIITRDKPARLMQTPKAPPRIDIRTDEDFAADPRILPGALRLATLLRVADAGRRSWLWSDADPGVFFLRSGWVSWSVTFADGACQIA